MRLGEVQQYRVGFGQNEAAINESRNFAGWINSQILRSAALAAVDVDVVNFRIQSQVPAYRQHFAAIRGKRRRIDFERYDFTA